MTGAVEFSVPPVNESDLAVRSQVERREGHSVVRAGFESRTIGAGAELPQNAVWILFAVECEVDPFGGAVVEQHAVATQSGGELLR